MVFSSYESFVQWISQFLLLDEYAFVLSSALMCLGAVLIIVYFMVNTLYVSEFESLKVIEVVLEWLDWVDEIADADFILDGTLFSYWVGFLFLYIFANNLIGMCALSYTLTTNISMTGFLSMVTWLGIFFLGIKNYRGRLFELFYVTGIPSYLIPLLAFVESLSYSFRCISLGLRLFANIASGHMLLEVVYSFVLNMVFSCCAHVCSTVSVFFSATAFVILTSMEVSTAFTQAYIFVVLSFIYLKDSFILYDNGV
jgi:F-type H+-transporting ATPase subunit a